MNLFFPLLKSDNISVSISRLSMKRFDLKKISFLLFAVAFKDETI